jgi:hypothetical protein
MVGRLKSRWTGDDDEERHVGRNVVALLIVSVVAAVVFAVVFRLGLPPTVLSLMVGGGAPAGLYMGWESLRRSGKPESKDSAPPDDVDDLTNELATVVLDQWQKEYARRTYGDPAQHARELTVAWSAARPSLGVSWESLVDLAQGAGAHEGMQPHRWALSPRGLTGIDHELPAILQKVPTGWLVVLGDSGSGKTMLLLRTIRDLIQIKQRAKNDDPVPVFISMASWDPNADSLRGWLEKRLPIDYPALGTVVSHKGRKASRIAILLDEQKIIPMLDGLDEMPKNYRVTAIDRLNEAFNDDPKRPLRLVMSSKTDAYEEAAARPAEGRYPVTAAAAIELHALDPDKVTSYLGARGKESRWAAVDAKLKQGDGSYLAQALDTPLYASLASAIYNAGRAKARGKLRNPAELCALPTEQSVHNHLLDEFLPAMYADEREALEGWQDGKDNDRSEIDRGEQPLLPAERWLMILADYMTHGRKETTTSLEWWNLRGLAPRWLVPGAVGAVCGIATAVAAATGIHVGVGIGIGFGTGMVIAIAIGVGLFRLHRRSDAGRVRRGRMNGTTFENRYQKRRPGPGMAGGMIGAVLGSLAAGIAGRHHIGYEPSLFSGLPEGLGMAIGAGASTDFFGGFAGTLLGSFAGGCLAAVWLGLPAGLVNGLGVGLAVALAIENVGRQAPSNRIPTWDKEIGIPGGIIIGAAIGLIAWRQEGIVYGILFGIILGAFAAVPFGLRHKDENLRSVPSPGEALTRDLQAFRLTALSAGMAAAAAGFLGISMSSIFEVHGHASWSSIIGDGLGVGVASGLVIGLTFGFYHAASPEYRIISWWLAIRGKAPWRLKSFLDDAYDRTVLRQSGATYQFRHLELQLRLAGRFEAEKSKRQRQRRRPLIAEQNQTARSAALAPAAGTQAGPVPDTH